MGPEGEGVAVLLPAGEAPVEASPHGPRLVRERRVEGHRDAVLHFTFVAVFFFVERTLRTTLK